jgi:hypothetical protein
MIGGELASALRRLDALLLGVCDAEEARAKRLFTDAQGWDALRGTLRATAGELAFDPAVPEQPLALPGELPALTAAAVLGLSQVEADALIVLIAPHVEHRYAKLYAVLQDEPANLAVTERLLIIVLGRSPARAAALAASLAPDGKLVATGIVQRAAGAYASQAQPIELAADVRGALLGLPRPAVIAGLDVAWRTGADEPEQPPVQVVWGGGEREDVAATIAGPELLIVHPRHGPDREVIDALWRRAVFAGATLVVDVAALGSDEATRTGERLHDLARRYGGPVVIETLAPISLPVPHHAAHAPGFGERRGSWAAAAAAHGATLTEADLDRLAGNHPVTRDQLDAIFGAATAHDARELNLTAYRQRRVEIRSANVRLGERTFDDLVLRAGTREALERLIYFVAARDRVAEARGLEAQFRVRRGPVVLFAGRSGTGKTLAAEVVATAIERPLAVVDLSRLVSKYIGETEKHIDEILRAAERSGAVLFFDEADALFSARTEVSSSNDHYANLEVGYLLQRIEQHDGLVILATNLQHSIDEAFLRRFHARIEFPFPDAEERRRIWSLLLGSAGAGLDLEPLLRHRLAGGDIRNAALKSFYLAARDDGPVTQAHVEHAVALELYELGRLSRVDGTPGDVGPRLGETLEVIENVLDAGLRDRFRKEIHIVHGAPTKEAMAGKRPAVSLAMYRLASTGDQGGRLAGIVVSAWSTRAQEEAELLGELLELLELLERRPLSIGGRSATLRVQKSFDFDVLHRLWSSHGHPLRPSLLVDLELA